MYTNQLTGNKRFTLPVKGSNNNNYYIQGSKKEMENEIKKKNIKKNKAEMADFDVLH